MLGTGGLPVVRLVGLSVVNQFDVVCPAVDEVGQHLDWVQPQEEPVRSLFADVRHCRRLVEPGKHLTPAITGHYGRKKQEKNDVFKDSSRLKFENN